MCKKYGIIRHAILSGMYDHEHLETLVEAAKRGRVITESEYLTLKSLIPENKPTAPADNHGCYVGR